MKHTDMKNMANAKKESKYMTLTEETDDGGKEPFSFAKKKSTVNSKYQTLTEETDDGEESPFAFTVNTSAVDSLRRVHVIAYSVGHLLNDLCASMWFVYLTWYIENVLGLDADIAAGSMMSGQFADGIMTLVVGLLSDKYTTRWGKRTPWYIFGTLLVIPSFAGIFSYPSFINTCHSDEECAWMPTRQAYWYITMPAIFTIGWAAVQISNMAVVNQITLDKQRRQQMIGYRNGFTSFANFFVLLCALYFFAAVPYNRVQQFQYLTWVCLPFGCATSLFYLFYIRETKLEQQAIEQDRRYKEVQMVQMQNQSMAESTTMDTSYRIRNTGSDLDVQNNQQVSKDWKGWLAMPIFYINGIVYTLVRVAVNLTMTIQPFYLELVPFFSQHADQSTSRALALVPLISYTAQILFSIFVQPAMNSRLKNITSQMIVAIFIVTIGSLPLAFLNSDNRNVVYWLSGIQGVGLLIMLNTATVLISEVIGDDTEQSAFVYGVYSFFDKLANGTILFYVVQKYSSDAVALKWVMATTPIICTFVAYLLTIIGKRLKRQ